ncbi:hypothetical protein GCM10022216_30680 [Sphingobacterium kyonggiense]|uniref:Tetratricopeptide repeat protein n=1 Tax=Sphingobacterium kyonggiense TaxID=714075 RepID=A0ABP7Z2M6_9SPHI
MTIKDLFNHITNLKLGTEDKKIALLQLQSRYYQDEKAWETALDKTLELAHLKPNHLVFVNLGSIYENLGKLKDAEY